MNWTAPLQAAGYPTDVILIDFETYFDETYSLKKMSTIEYMQDERFEILGLAVYDPLTAGPAVFLTGAECDKYINTTLRETKKTILAYNARFDMGILAYRFGIVSKYHVDILGLSRAWDPRAANSLAAVCQREGLIEKGETSDFKGFTRRPRYKPASKRRKKDMSTPPVLSRRPLLADNPEVEAALAAYAINDAEREWEVFQLMIRRLSTPAIEIPLIQHTVDLWIRPRLQFDNENALALIEKMNAELFATIRETGHVRKDISGLLSFEQLMLAALDAAGEDGEAYKKPAKNKKGWKLAIAKNDPQRARLEQHSNPDIRMLMEAKGALASWPNHIKRIQRLASQTKAAGGVLPIPIRYCGGITGRFSGDEKLNVQNLGSRSHPLVNQIRNLLVAPPGHRLVIADAAQIEPRVLAWLAGQDDVLDQFRNHEPIYCNFASKVLGKKIRKPRAGGIPEVEDYYRWARQSVGKVGVLGANYGAGAVKIAAVNSIPLALAQQIVSVYRRSNKRIVRFWNLCEEHFRKVVRYSRGYAIPHVKFAARPGSDVIIILPSGRELKYHQVRENRRLDNALEVYNPRINGWEAIYSSKLAENITQAVSRDILVYAIQGMEAAGYPVVLHCHDEIVACVPEAQAEAALEAAIKLFSMPPTWGRDIPLSAEGVVAREYGNH